MSSSEVPRKDPLDLIHKGFEFLLNNCDPNGFDMTILRGLNTPSASYTPTPRVSMRFTVRMAQCNLANNLHGGATAAIFDICTVAPFALIQKEGWWETTGVSRNLSVSYLGPVKAGEEVEITIELVTIGKRFAHLRGDMKRTRDAAVVATMVHDKVNNDPGQGKL